MCIRWVYEDEDGGRRTLLPPKQRKQRAANELLVLQLGLRDASAALTTRSNPNKAVCPEP